MKYLAIYLPIKDFDYLLKYFYLINNPSKFTINDYTEKHHILPKCLNGKDNKENIIELKYQDHVLAHYYLYKAVEHDGLKASIILMSKQNRPHKLTIKQIKEISKIGPWNKNKKLSKEHKEKISKSSKGRKHTEKTKQKLSKVRKGKNNPFYGKKHTKETKTQIAKKGKNNPFYGKKHTKETKEKLSKVNLGRKHSEKTKQKISKNHINISGENHPRAKLNKKQTTIIKWLLKNSDLKQTEIAKIFKVSDSRITDIKQGKSW